jgi:hypothetical protein
MQMGGMHGVHGMEGMGGMHQGMGGMGGGMICIIGFIYIDVVARYLLNE